MNEAKNNNKVQLSYSNYFSNHLFNCLLPSPVCNFCFLPVLGACSCGMRVLIGCAVLMYLTVPVLSCRALCNQRSPPLFCLPQHASVIYRVVSESLRSVFSCVKHFGTPRQFNNPTALCFTAFCHFRVFQLCAQSQPNASSLALHGIVCQRRRVFVKRDVLFFPAKMSRKLSLPTELKPDLGKP